MAQKTFGFKIEGNGVSPSTIRLRDLYEALHAFESAVSVVASQSLGSKDASDFHIVSIGEGSANCLIEIDETGYRAAVICAEAIASSDLSTLPKRSIDRLLDLGKQARIKAWSFSVDNNNGMAPATISPSSEFRTDAIVVGATTIFAQVVRVGGSPKATVTLLVPGNAFLPAMRLNASVATVELATRLGNLLYHHVAVVGDAEWSSAGWNLVSFKVTDIGEFSDESNVVQTLEELAAIAGDHWDEIDPDEYISSIRDESA